MAYIVFKQTNSWVWNYFYQYRTNAWAKFSELANECGYPIFDTEPTIPYWIDVDNWRVRIKHIDWWDNSNDKFIFFDNEENWLLVLWDRATFWAEYTKLTKKYEKDEREWSDFYDKLEKNLLGKGVQIISDIPIIREKDLDWK